MAQCGILSAVCVTQEWCCHVLGKQAVVGNVVGVQRRKEMGRAGNIVDEIRPCRRPSLILNRYCSCALWTERFPKHVDRLRGNRN